MKTGMLWLLLLIPCTLFAAVPPDALHPTVWLGASLLDFDYEEYTGNPATANREKGTLPGLTTGLSVRQDHWFAETGINAWSGNVDYHGPVETRTREQIVDWNILAGREIYRRDRGAIGLLAGLGYRNWERDIHSTATASGLLETYDWWYGMLGLRGEYDINARTRLRADVCLTRTINPEIKVDFESNFDDVKLDLGEKTGSRVRLFLDHELGETVRVWLSPWYEFWELGRSATRDLTRNGSVIGTVVEPRSKTGNYGIDLGISWTPEFH